jgi:hypothetical protein
MGLFRRGPAWDVELADDPIRPGGAVAGTLHIKKGEPGAAVRAHAHIEVSGREPTTQISSADGRSGATDVAADLLWFSELVAEGVLDDGGSAALPFRFELPLRILPHQVRDFRLFSPYEGAQLRLGQHDIHAKPRTKKLPLAVEALPVHERLVAGLEALGCPPRKVSVWKGPPLDPSVTIRAPFPKELEDEEHKLSHLAVQLRPTDPDRGEAHLVVCARRRAVEYRVAEATVAVNEDATAWAANVREQLQPVQTAGPTGSGGDSSAVAGEALDTLLRWWANS